MSTRKYKTASDYYNAQAEDTRKNLLVLRGLILRAAPHARELINYGIPAFALVKDGKRDKQVMIAGYKAFVGFYPGASVLSHFSARLKSYKVGKASVQFPNDRPLPTGLITDIVRLKLRRSTAV